ncbi:MAG: type II toxin-antitoxin system VapC family toxin [Gammaproteobacteria bacterium]|nr:type II toxin-antitoxin system VapC family toxin [Gammaproteobacteria bacterium]
MLDGLGDHPVLAVDTAPIIYWLEGHPRLVDRFAPVFEAAESGRAEIVISTITLAEVLAGPLRAGNELLTAQYREALTRGRGWQALPLDAEVATEAARIRAVYRLRLPDAVQVATAIRAGAAALVTHDRELCRVKGLRVIGAE